MPTNWYQPPSIQDIARMRASKEKQAAEQQAQDILARHDWNIPELKETVGGVERPVRPLDRLARDMADPQQPMPEWEAKFRETPVTKDLRPQTGLTFQQRLALKAKSGTGAPKRDIPGEQAEAAKTFLSEPQTIDEVDPVTKVVTRRPATKAELAAKVSQTFKAGMGDPMVKRMLGFTPTPKSEGSEYIKGVGIEPQIPEYGGAPEIQDQPEPIQEEPVQGEDISADTEQHPEFADEAEAIAYATENGLPDGAQIIINGEPRTWRTGSQE